MTWKGNGRSRSVMGTKSVHVVVANDDAEGSLMTDSWRNKRILIPFPPQPVLPSLVRPRRASCRHILSSMGYILLMHRIPFRTPLMHEF